MFVSPINLPETLKKTEIAGTKNWTMYAFDRRSVSPCCQRNLLFFRSVISLNISVGFSFDNKVLKSTDARACFEHLTKFNVPLIYFLFMIMKNAEMKRLKRSGHFC